MKRAFVILFYLVMFMQPVFSAPGTIVTYIIDPEKNAYAHNNKGIMYLEEKCYYAAIQEFKIAISLNPKAQSTSVYFNNLGKTYLIIGYPELALDCFKNALNQYSLNLDYYINLAKCYKQLGKAQQQLTIVNSEKSNPMTKVMAGMLEEQLGNKKKAITLLDDFVNSEPDLIITPAIKEHIKELIDDMKG